MHLDYPHNISEETALLAAGKLYSYLKNDTSISFGEDEIRKAIQATQVMIDINLKHLTGLRVTCDPSQHSKQNDIRLLENKLVRLFSQQLITRRRFIEYDDIYELRNIALFTDWLLIIGLDHRSKQIFIEQFDDIEDFLRINDDKLTEILLIGHELSRDEHSLVHSRLKGFQFDIFKQQPPSRSSTNILGMSDGPEPWDEYAHVVAEVKRFQKAQKCFRVCLGSLEGGEELSHTKELFWDSREYYWPTNKVNGARKHSKRKASMDSTVIDAYCGKFSPQPLPPLAPLSSSMHRNNRIASPSNNHTNNNQQLHNINGTSCKSTGSSPLSPVVVTSGRGGHCGGGGTTLATLSAASSSSSIIPPNFFGSTGVIVDPNHHQQTNGRRFTPPVTPPVTHHKRSSFLTSSLNFYGRKNSDTKFPSTPPATRRQQANVVEQFPLTKSKSHEEQLSNRIEPLDPMLMSKMLKKYNFLSFGTKPKKDANSMENLPHHHQPYRRRLATEPGSLGSTSPLLSSSACSSPISPQIDKQSDCFTDNGSLHSPGSSKGVLLTQGIFHRFATTMKINITCNVCDKQMFIGVKCRDCKLYAHRDCSIKVSRSCGMPMEYYNIYKNSVFDKDSRSPSVGSQKSLSSLSFSSLHRTKTNFVHSTGRSCSNPSSPAVFTTYSSTSISPTLSNSVVNSQFQFPPELVTNGQESSESSLLEENKNISTIHEEDETQRILPTIHLTTSAENSVDSDKTLTNSIDSQNGNEAGGGGGATLAGGDKPQWPRQNSTCEWDIPYDELVLQEEIGAGRFGRVFRGQWHGSVAIKRIDLSNIDEDRAPIESFKREVATFRKTRHDNLVLFMGACMRPPHLAIVTEFCRGATLHTHIHTRQDKFNFNRTCLIAEQICLGMGYLHARGIIHKDLKTKNIFYDSGKVVITDFGLSSVSKLCVSDKRGDWLTVPKGWLCYLAPEIIRTLNIDSNETDNLPFTIKTDVYAFSTVWHELLFGCYPFTGQASEVIIWQIGRGIKQVLNFHQASKEVKELLYLCWSFEHDKRPDFRELYDLIQKLPKKRLQRSPSHPTHLQQTPEQHF